MRTIIISILSALLMAGCATSTAVKEGSAISDSPDWVQSMGLYTYEAKATTTITGGNWVTLVGLTRTCCPTLSGPRTRNTAVTIIMDRTGRCWFRTCGTKAKFVMPSSPRRKKSASHETTISTARSRKGQATFS